MPRRADCFFKNKQANGLYMAKPGIIKRIKAWKDWHGKGWKDIRQAVNFVSTMNDPGHRSRVKYGTVFITTFPKTSILQKRARFSLGVSISSFESPICVKLSRHMRARQPGNKPRERNPEMAQVRLGFEKGSVVIRALQGTEGQKRAFRHFRLVTGKPAMNYLVEQVEKHAKETGFGFVKIARPETLQYYKYPDLGVRRIGGRFEQEREKIRKEMNALYYGLAKKMGYKKEEKFFVKRL
jgi:hypothetical protein